MNKSSIALALITAALLSACGPDKVSFNTLEDARAQAKANALFNAQVYRAESPRLGGFGIVAHGDSTQTPDCPQGDGWASVSYMLVEGNNVAKYTAKCSTVSGTVGCYLDADFQKKTYASDDGRCQPVEKVPFPLPKLTK